MKFSKLKSFISFCSYGFTFLLGTYVSIPEMGTNKNSLFLTQVCMYSIASQVPHNSYALKANKGHWKMSVAEFTIKPSSELKEHFHCS